MAKISPAKADAFIARLPSDVVAIVLFGPDTALSNDRTASAIQGYLGGSSSSADAADRHDPLAVMRLRGSDLKGNPARLADEARSPTLLGGKRVIHVSDAGDALGPSVAAALKDLAASPPPDVLVIIEAGDLKPSSALRKAAESASSAIAAVACYAMDGTAMQSFIAGAARADGLDLTGDALQALSEAVGSDRGVARRQIEKLSLYLDVLPRTAPSVLAGASGTAATASGRPPTAGLRTVSVDDIAQCVGESADRTLDELALAVAEGNVGAVGRAYRASLDQGATTVGILRAVQRHLTKLTPAVDARENGIPPSKAISEIKPPVFWKHKDRVSGQIASWRSAALRSALERLVDAEVQCKTTGIPDISLCERTLFQVSRLSGRPAR